MNIDTIRNNNYMFSFGPGSIYELTDKTVMILGPDYWDSVTPETYKEINDSRLAARMNVENLYQPPEQNDISLKARVFPDWQVCQNGQCKGLFRYSEHRQEINKLRNTVVQLYKSYNKNNQKDTVYRSIPKIFCPHCLEESMQKYFNGMIPMNPNPDQRESILKLRISNCISFRWISVCPNGHVDDLNFYEMMNITDAEKSLYYLKFQHFGMDLNEQFVMAIPVNSQGSKKRISLATIKTMTPKCDGHVYWRKTRGGFFSESCDGKTRIVQKGDSLVYFPDVITSLAIPPYSRVDYKSIRKDIITLIEEIWNDSANTVIHNAREILCEVNNIRDSRAQRQIRRIADVIVDELYSSQDDKDGNRQLAIELVTKKVTDLGYDDLLEEVQESLKKDQDPNDMDAMEYIYRTQEYHQLIQEKDWYNCQPPFSVRVKKSPEKLRFLKHLVIADDISITYTQKYFRRLGPEEKRQQIKTTLDWLPAIQIRGEGIFLDFNVISLEDWYTSNKTLLDKQFSKVSVNELKSISCSDIKAISFFYLLHSFSHYLINALSFVTGYNAASMRERLYINSTPIDDELGAIYGILISSSTGDSEASLGGLAYYGFEEKIYELLYNTLFKLKACSNDPICWESMPHDGINNYAACFSCLFLPETACEFRNEYLDRKLMIGDGDGKTEIKGFFIDKGIL